MNGQAIAGANGSCFNASQPGTYDCLVWNPCSAATPTATPGATLTVNTAPIITAQPQTQTNCTGTTASFSVAASGTSPFSYQWRRGTTNLTNGGRISGATSPTLTITGVDTGDAASDYNCVVSNSCGTATSTNATLTVNTAPIIITQPVDQTYCGGASTVQFCVQVSGNALGFQWYRRCGNSVMPLGTARVSPCSPSFVPEPGDESCEFYCEAFSGTCRPGIFSTIARVRLATPPTITQQPLGPLFSRGNCSPFSVSIGATGSDPLTYQWFINGVPVDCVSNPSACANRIEVPRLQLTPGSYQFSCSVTNSCRDVQSNILTIPVVCVADFDDGRFSGLPDGGVTIEDLMGPLSNCSIVPRCSA